MAKLSQSGNIQVPVRSYGCTENVMSLVFGSVVSLELIIITSIAGAGKSVLSYAGLSILSAWRVMFCRHPVPQSSRISAACAHRVWPCLRFFIATSGIIKKGTVVDYSYLSWYSVRVGDPTSARAGGCRSLPRCIAPLLPDPGKL